MMISKVLMTVLRSYSIICCVDVMCVEQLTCCLLVLVEHLMVVLLGWGRTSMMARIVNCAKYPI